MYYTHKRKFVPCRESNCNLSFLQYRLSLTHNWHNTQLLSNFMLTVTIYPLESGFCWGPVKVITEVKLNIFTCYLHLSACKGDIIFSYEIRLNAGETARKMWSCEIVTSNVISCVSTESTTIARYHWRYSPLQLSEGTQFRNHCVTIMLCGWPRIASCNASACNISPTLSVRPFVFVMHKVIPTYLVNTRPTLRSDLLVSTEIFNFFLTLWVQ
jgi:hypothetical protein